MGGRGMSAWLIGYLAGVLTVPLWRNNSLFMGNI